MNRYTIAASVLLSATVAAGACRSDEEKMTTSADVQIQSAKAANTPTTLTGSL